MNYCNQYPELEKFKGLRVAVLTTESAQGEAGGAERFYQGLLAGLIEIGCDAEIVQVIADESSFDQISKNYQYCRDLDLSRFDAVVSTKTPSYAVNHPNHVMYLVHTVRVFDDMFYETFPGDDPIRLAERAMLHQWDFEAISRVKAKFAIGHEVSNRLYRWRGIHCDVIHPPLGVNGFKQGTTGDYFFLPGRLHPWKRVHLAIEAVKASSLPLRLVIAGTGEAEQELKALAAGDSRIEFVGRLSDEELLDYYANALAIAFVPKKEDYGYVTLEGFASGKPVITCADSGEPTFFVKHKETGLICEATPEALCEGFEWLFNNVSSAIAMGQRGHELIKGMSWATVSKQLISAAMAPQVTLKEMPLSVVVADMQPIDPPIGGGRLRLLGLYHGLGENVKATYVGSYDWPGEKYRRHQLSPGLEEINIPLSQEHHLAAQEWAAQANGKTVIDVVFSQQGHLSPDYLTSVIENIKQAEVVVFSHPWVYPLIDPNLLQGKVVVYDSQNVEGYLRAQLFDDSNVAELAAIRQVIADEYLLGQRADLILACSQEDLLRFYRIYEFSPEKMRVVPNGVMAFTHQVPGDDERSAAKVALKYAADDKLAIFIGSAYGPNVEAAKFIAETLAPLVPEVTFVIAGGVGSVVEKVKYKNVHVTGMLSEEDKALWLSAADIAVNPMFSGSGTNIKMFDFMSMAMPTVTTKIGARGIDTGGLTAMLVVEPTKEAFATAISDLFENEYRRKVGTAARACVESSYAWERISDIVGRMLSSRAQLANQPQPHFSVVIPSYERPDQLLDLVSCLQKQTERDFEVIIVDQSEKPWSERGRDFGFPLCYYHSPVKGAVRARNTGAMLAQGKVIAFTDDDCRPGANWLANARKYFEVEGVVGVEGIIISDHHGDDNWRPVTNVGFESIGFMTANLMVRNSVFQYLGGFDLQFDHPHFREDTDFGWRMQQLGLVPYAKDVDVFHPAQLRSKERESASSRARFFQKDVLLYRKHPEKYQELFLQERHYVITSGFKENLLLGFKIENEPVPQWMAELLNA
ncbi:glycosyltransferase [Atlantibacter hermannii]|uniref:glycosyltransferase n=1 Tax=Atlantibacter hermannii TaxID=565 RepID=UPI001C705047|nr:glycosyltransferase [Atlantibacter hermannii]MBW9432343.1 glycosyltransferase [Atlantibacter hermannii]MDQ7883572.1 glycosyltransferase [Atlantibacter hermannii]